MATDQRYQNQGLGRALLRDAMLRAVHVAGHAGVFAMLVHSYDDPTARAILAEPD